MHRPKKGGETDTQFVRFDLKDHSNYSPSKHAPPNKSKYPKRTAFSQDELPIGLAYFDSDQNKDAFAPITYAPVPETVFNRPRKHKKSTTNHLKNRIFQTHNGEGEPTTMQSVQNMIIHPKPNFIKFGTVEDVTTTDATFKPEEARLHHSAPEMYKFTLDDAVVRPSRSKHLGKSNALRDPVTTASQSFDELPSNIDVHTQPVVHYDSIHTDHIATDEPKYFYRHTRNNERNSTRTIRKIERGRPVQSAVTRQYRRVEAKSLPVTTTENPLTETNGKDELQIKATVEKWPLPLQRYSPRSRHTSRRRLVSEPIARIMPEQMAYESQRNLEVSPSYTKQRTQGFNSAEDVSTTPMTPAMATLVSKQHRSRQTHLDGIGDAATAQKQSERALPNNNQAKYFQ